MNRAIDHFGSDFRLGLSGERTRWESSCIPLILAGGIVLLAAPANAADRLPAAMLGKWASDPAACGEQASELALTVEPRSLLFYEHGLEIRRIAKQKDGSLKASGFHVDDQGRAKGSITLKLAGDELDAGGQIYHRCRSAGAAE